MRGGSSSALSFAIASLLRYLSSGIGRDVQVTTCRSPSVPITRWPSTGQGRSRTVAYGGLVWTVANATDPSADFEAQAAQSLAMLESHLAEAGSARTHLLSLQVILTEIANRDAFD